MHKKPLGIKYDAGKPRYDLLPFREVEQIVMVLTMGAKKYADGNWMHVKPKQRYLRALLGHIWSRVRGEILDKESGLPHLAHAACCLLFLMWADNEKESWTS